MRRSLIALAVLAFAIALLLWWQGRPAVLSKAVAERIAVPQSVAGRAAFESWLADEPGRAEEFAAFDAYISGQGYADLLPPWTLLRANVSRSERCRAEPFMLPPRRLWGNILPALRLVREQAIPAVGRVEVASAFRDPALNICSGGARGSRHLSFSALDLLPLDQPDAPTSFRKLCAAWRSAGRSSAWGLGAYHDPARPTQNPVGRFHVDGTGWRTWGFGYTRASSVCNSL